MVISIKKHNCYVCGKEEYIYNMYPMPIDGTFICEKCFNREPSEKEIEESIKLFFDEENV